MTEADESLLRRFCPDAILTLYAANLLLTRRRRLREAEDRGETNRRVLGRLTAEEAQASLALETMLTRLGHLPGFSET